MRANRMMKDQKVNSAGTGAAITGEVMTDEEVKAKKEQKRKPVPLLPLALTSPRAMT